MSYRLEVVTDRIDEAVLRAGGLMFDHCRAGWQVVVVTVDATHAEALAILGVRAEPPGAESEGNTKQDRSFRTVVAPLEHLTTPESTADASLLWGEPLGETAGRVLLPVRHQLSAAARAFKSHAMRCAGLQASDMAEERFWIRDRPPLSAVSGRSGTRSPTMVGGWAGG
ncbi:hypothetical protein [Mycolicibacterium parafortuitum]|uniref:Uncharacterized protein n=1 Tax=Mycolicibacterium parafortuitum TaxID=39692 RepID=A0A375YQC8_MYCPF|nr:hypothetical protein [Mycolicibacterium parafortuitum]ORB28215.1 hypothetical protein BST38_20690 [Mycolicibacterium parafortuitum]SRX83322.1 hypothetical protein MPP7335_05097 [Mycolicibacterium parafortuitum]